jgi:hypothetical protein
MKNDELLLGFTGISIADEFVYKFRRYEYKTILELCEEWSVEKIIFSAHGEDLPTIYKFDDGSTLNIGTMTASWWHVPNDEERAQIRRSVEKG